MKWARIVVLGAAVAAGCDYQSYRSQSLGQINYDKAFAASRTVLSRYFTNLQVDADAGRITSAPRRTDAGADRLLATSPARQIARMRLRPKNGEVVAEIRVEVQRQDLAASRQMQPVTVDNELPSRQPARETAPLSPEQQQAWQTTGRDEALERQIMAELLNEIRGAP